jgi:hypothetical protein
MANELGVRNVAFEVDDLQAAVERLAADGYELVSDIGEYEHSWRMAHVRLCRLGLVQGSIPGALI